MSDLQPIVCGGRNIGRHFHVPSRLSSAGHRLSQFCWRVRLTRAHSPLPLLRTDATRSRTVQDCFLACIYDHLILYIVTVKCKVYRLYSNGAKLAETVRPGTPKIGRLVYAAKLRHEQIRLTVFTAQLLEFNGDQNLIPPIDSAVIMRINERGILLCGQELIVRRGGVKSRCDYYRQSWVCKPLVME